MNPDTFTFTHFEVREFSNNKYGSFYRNTAGRIRNSFLKAINQHTSLPKLVVTILDDDLARSVQGTDDMEQKLFDLTKWLINEMVKSINEYKDYLPPRAKKPDYPHFLFIAPPTHKYFGNHNNQLRDLQTSILEDITKTYTQTTTLHMIKHWDHDDGSNFLRNHYRFTSDGLMRYWLSINSAIHYWEVIASKKKLSCRTKQDDQKVDKYHWHNSFKSSHQVSSHNRKSFNDSKDYHVKKEDPVPTTEVLGILEGIMMIAKTIKTLEDEGCLHHLKTIYI